MTVDFVIDEVKEEIKIKEFLKQVDHSYYHRKIENRLGEMKKFPLLGEDGRLFMDTYQYVNLFQKKNKDNMDK